MARWIRFEHQGQTGFGTLDGATISGARGRHVRGAPADRGDAAARRGQGADPVHAVQDDLPVEQLPRAGRAPGRRRAGRAALLPEVAERLPRPWRDHPPAALLQRQRGLRGRARHRHRQALQQRQRGRGRGSHLRLHLRRRRHRRRPHPQEPDLRPVGARQELRHVRRVRPGDRDRPRPDGSVDPHRARRPGAPELPGQRHDLSAAPAGQLPVARHDAPAGRRDRLRHLDRGQRDARPPPHHRDRDRGHRHLEQRLRAAGAVPLRRGADPADAHRRGRRRRDRRPDGGEARGRRPSGHRDRPGRAARRDPGQRPEADLGGRQRAGGAGPGGRERRRGRPAGPRDPRGQGPLPRPGGARARRHARARHHGHDHPERPALVVLPAPRRAARRPEAREPRSLGHPHAQDRARSA